MVRVTARVFGRAALVAAVALLASGCATRYDAWGNQIYVWQFGQDTIRDIDYSNPRMPILPRRPPSTDLWPTPSPYEFNDLSRWSKLEEPLPIATRIADLGRDVGDNARCATCIEPTARLALPAPRADDRGVGVRAPR